MNLNNISTRIYEIRGQSVMLDFDLSILYEVENRALKQAVRRNLERFPSDFMFQLSNSEWKEVITFCDNLPEALKYSPITPFAFTEQGIAMLSGVLRSKKAIEMNIAIMRAFVLLRQFALSHKDVTRKLHKLENRYDKKFHDIFDAITFLIKKDAQTEKQKQRKRIGFVKDDS